MSKLKYYRKFHAKHYIKDLFDGANDTVKPALVTTSIKYSQTCLSDHLY
jgi:hypothetical protein